MVQVRPARYGESHLMSAFRSTPPFGVPTAPPSGFTVMVGRVPIFDRRRQVYGYELRFRSAGAAAAEAVTADDRAAHLIADGVLSIGLDTLTHDSRAFVALTPAFLRHDVINVLPADRVVLEIAADAVADAETLGACRQLKTAGYQLALGGYTDAHAATPLVPLVDFIKMRAGSSASRPAMHGHAGATIASDVQTIDAFHEAVRGGFTHVQGSFFEQPATVPARPIPRGQIGYMRLLYALNDAHLALRDLEDLMKHDASLCYRLLRTVNSAGFAQSREITSIRDALLLVGRDTVRRWASLWVMTDLGVDAHAELVLMASVRGRFCELLAENAPALGGGAFLLGMCSCLDVILAQPMAAVVAELPLAPDVSDALLGRENPTRHLLDCVIAYERGDWPRALAAAAAAGIRQASLAPAHAAALTWTHQIRRAEARRPTATPRV
jgi:EAL and modified HD-GYP domain-containing signal transduction protein